MPVAVGISDDHRQKLLTIFGRLERPWVYTDTAQLSRLNDFGEEHDCSAEVRKLDARALRVGIRDGQAVEDRVQHDARLHPREVHAEAAVGAEGEGHVGLLRAPDVEGIGILVARLVAVGRSEVDVQDRAGRNQRTVDLDVAGGGAHDAHQRALPAQPLLDRLGHQAAVGAQRVELVAVGEQAEEQVAGGPVGRLRAGGRQQAQEGDQDERGRKPSPPGEDRPRQ